MNTDVDNEIVGAEAVAYSDEVVRLESLMKINENLKSIASLGELSLGLQVQASCLDRDWTEHLEVPT